VTLQAAKVSLFLRLYFFLAGKVVSLQLFRIMRCRRYILLAGNATQDIGPLNTQHKLQ